jgi:redox-regulated HSP33 family molecular chaperone
MIKMVKDCGDGTFREATVYEKADELEVVCDWCNKECAGIDGVLVCDGGIIENYFTCNECAKNISKTTSLETTFKKGEIASDVIQRYYSNKGFKLYGPSFSFEHYLKHEMIK